MESTSRIEDKIRALNAYNRGLIEASLDPLVTISHDGKISDVNKATELVTEANREELLGTDFSQYFTEPQKAKRGYQEVFSKGFVKDYPLAIRGRSGRVTDVLYNATVYRNDAGEIQGVFAAARDVTERKHMEEELRQSSLYVRSLIEASLDPLVTIDKEGKITDVNVATEKVTGFSRKELIGTNFSRYFTEVGKAEEGYQLVLKNGSVRDYALTIKHRDHTETHVLYNATTYQDENGNTLGVFAAAHDITERLRIEDELKGRLDELRCVYEIEKTIEKYGSDLDEILKHVVTLIPPAFNFSDNAYARIVYLGKKFETDDFKETQWRLLSDIRTYGEKTGFVEVHYSRKKVAFTDSFVREEQILLDAVSERLGRVTERITAERKVREASVYARSLIEASLDPLVTISVQGKITDVNEATEQVTGVRREKLIGSDFSDYFTEPEKAKGGYKQVFAQGIVRDYPLAIRHASGKVTDVLYNATVFKNETGEVQGVFAAARDVTERRRLEEQLRRYSQHLEELIEEKTSELRDSEEKFRTIYEESPIGIEVRDSNGQFLGVNNAWTDIFGISELSAAREFIFQNLNLPNELKESLFKGERWKQEITFDFDEMKKTGLIDSARSGICYLDVSAIPISIKEKKSPIGYMIWYENITERKRDEETLALRAGLLSRVHDAVVASDPNFNIIYWNDAAEEMFGWTEKEVLGKNGLEVLQTKIPGSSREEAIDKLLRDGHYEGETHYRRKDGTYVLTDARSSALRGPGGEMQGIVTSIRDITERKKMETLRDQFISAVTHELRTPLVSIKGYTDYLLTGRMAQLPEKVMRSLAVVKDQSDRLLRMTNDLLDYRRLTSGKFEIDLKPVDLKHVVATSVVETQGILVGRKQNLQLEIAKEPIEVTGDYSRLVQVVSNLLVNASKFSPENGKIRLTVSKDEGMCKVSVSDNGIGIKSEDLTRVFEPFAAIVKPTYVKGTGLGLSVSKGLVEAHNGRIWIESAGEGKGSIVTFTVPSRKTD